MESHQYLANCRRGQADARRDPVNPCALQNGPGRRLISTRSGHGRTAAAPQGHRSTFWRRVFILVHLCRHTFGYTQHCRQMHQTFNTDCWADGYRSLGYRHAVRSNVFEAMRLSLKRLEWDRLRLSHLHAGEWATHLEASDIRGDSPVQRSHFLWSGST